MVNLSVVVPCFNEEEVLPETIKRLTDVLNSLLASGKISASSRIYFVDDGSRDATWRLIEESADSAKPVIGVKLSRNRGHQNALLAGLFGVLPRFLRSQHRFGAELLRALQRREGGEAPGALEIGLAIRGPGTFGLRVNGRSQRDQRPEPDHCGNRRQ